MFFISQETGFVGVREHIERAKTFEEAERNLFGLLDIKSRIGHHPIFAARLRNLVSFARRKREELVHAPQC